MKTSTLLTAIFLLAAPLPRAHAAEDPASILARAKAASGGKAWDDVKTLYTRAKVSTGGLDGTVESWEDVRTGRYVATFKLGPVQGAEGFDGKVPWTQDSSGQTRTDDSGDGLEGAANEAYRRSLSYWFPGRHKAEISYAGEKTEGSRSFHVLHIVPAGGRPFEMWMDAQTGLTDRTVEQTAAVTNTTIFSDYREVEGLRIPFSLRITNGEVKYDQTVIVESVQVNAPVDEAKLQMPEAKSHDFAIANGKTSETIPFRLLNNHVYIQVRIGGKPFQFLFDTGGINILTPETQERLGLKAEGAIEMRGVGEKSADTALARVPEIAIGGVTLRDQVFFVVPLTGLDAAEGLDVDGIVGYELIKRFIARVEYAKGRLTFTLPEAFQPPAGAAVVPFTFEDNTPQVEGEIDGVKGVFTIDTGSRASLSLNVPFVQEHGLKAKYAPRIEAMSGWGVGGGVRSLFTRAKRLKLGGVEVPAPVTDLPQVEKGSFAKKYLAGNVGGGVLRRFDVTFDYGGKRMFLAPNEGFSKPDAYDRAGLWLNRDGDGFKVMDVTAGGPAAEAGLKAGDAVLAIDGRSTKDLLLPEVREGFKTSAPGTNVRLAVKSGDGTRDVTLVLRDLV